MHAAMFQNINMPESSSSTPTTARKFGDITRVFRDIKNLSEFPEVIKAILRDILEMSMCGLTKLFTVLTSNISVSK